MSHSNDDATIDIIGKRLDSTDSTTDDDWASLPPARLRTLLLQASPPADELMPPRQSGALTNRLILTVLQYATYLLQHALATPLWLTLVGHCPTPGNSTGQPLSYYSTVVTVRPPTGTTLHPCSPLLYIILTACPSATPP